MQATTLVGPSSDQTACLHMPPVLQFLLLLQTVASKGLFICFNKTSFLICITLCNLSVKIRFIALSQSFETSAILCFK